MQNLGLTSLLLVLVLTTSACKSPSNRSARTDYLPPLPAPERWQLVWSDEFHGAQLIPWRNGQITMNLHWDGYGKEHKSAGSKVTRPELTEGFHTFSLLWTPQEYVFYADGKETWRSAAGGVSQVPEFIKLTEEIGTWAGDIKKAALPDFFAVDYVRVYDRIEK
jgi:hypothetical protein